MSQIKKFEKQQNILKRNSMQAKRSEAKGDTRLPCQNTSTKLDHPL